MYIIGLLLPLHYICMCLYRDEINVTRHPHPRPESACLPACNTVLIMLLTRDNDDEVEVNSHPAFFSCGINQSV